MSTASKRLLSPEEYLALERHADFRSEYYAGEMFAMAGASWEHSLIKDNLARAVGNNLASSHCHVLTSDLRVKVSPTGLYTYPDIVIVCDKPEFEDKHFDTLLNPQILIEVLSDSTEKNDRGTKSAHYRRLTSLKEYVLVAQDRLFVERYVRQPDGSWLLTEFNGLDAVFSFGTIAAPVALADIYRGVELPEVPLRDATS
jgi:Uma2 family endonuclease